MVNKYWKLVPFLTYVIYSLYVHNIFIEVFQILV
jgi:hypothetical protein